MSVTALAGGGAVTVDDQQRVAVDWPDSSGVMADNYGSNLSVYLHVNDSRRGHLTGIFGNDDGDADNDFITRDGTPVGTSFTELYQTFANSWRISQNESLFDYATGETTDSYTDRSFQHRPAMLSDLSVADRAAAQETCHASGVVDGTFLDNCVLDVALTGDTNFASAAVTAQGNLRYIAPAEPATLTISTPGENATRTFAGSAGQAVSLTVSGNTIASATVSVLDPSGNTLHAIGISDATGFLDATTLPVTGTYTVLVDPYEENTGAATLLLHSG